MQDNWVDFKAIKAAVTMEMILGRYGVNWLRKKDDELRGRCPIHQGEGQSTFHVSLSKNVFQLLLVQGTGQRPGLRGRNGKVFGAGRGLETDGVVCGSDGSAADRQPGTTPERGSEHGRGGKQATEIPTQGR